MRASRAALVPPRRLLARSYCTNFGDERGHHGSHQRFSVPNSDRTIRPSSAPPSPSPKGRATPLSSLPHGHFAVRSMQFDRVRLIDR